MGNTACDSYCKSLPGNTNGVCDLFNKCQCDSVYFV